MNQGAANAGFTKDKWPIFNPALPEEWAAKALSKGGEEVRWFFGTKPNYTPVEIIPDPPAELDNALHDAWREMYIASRANIPRDNLISNGRVTSVFDLETTEVPFYYDHHEEEPSSRARRETNNLHRAYDDGREEDNQRKRRVHIWNEATMGFQGTNYSLYVLSVRQYDLHALWSKLAIMHDSVDEDAVQERMCLFQQQNSNPGKETSMPGSKPSN
jgi:hypothetical protein